MRPPGRGSNVTTRPGSADTEWPFGHHSGGPVGPQVEGVLRRAVDGEGELERLHLLAPRVRPCVLGREAEAARGIAPDLLEVRPDGRDALVVQAVQPSCALRAVRHE